MGRPYSDTLVLVVLMVPIVAANADCETWVVQIYDTAALVVLVVPVVITNTDCGNG